MSRETFTTLLACFAAIVAMSVLIDGERSARTAREHCRAMHGQMQAYESVCVVSTFEAAPRHR